MFNHHSSCLRDFTGHAKKTHPNYTRSFYFSAQMNCYPCQSWKKILSSRELWPSLIMITAETLILRQVLSSLGLTSFSSVFSSLFLLHIFKIFSKYGLKLIGKALILILLAFSTPSYSLPPPYKTKQDNNNVLFSHVPISDFLYSSVQLFVRSFFLNLVKS